VRTINNQRIVLAERPVGEPKHSDFRIEQVELSQLKQGEMLLKTIYLSLDPYMRGRMSDAPSYAAPVEIGEVMVGGTVSQVVASKNPKFSPFNMPLKALIVLSKPCTICSLYLIFPSFNHSDIC
jgi:NADPH-dependent curcumin reductase